MAKKTYNTMNNVPIGTKMKIKSTTEDVELVEIQNYPTTFLVKNKEGQILKCLTYEVEIIDWP